MKKWPLLCLLTISLRGWGWLDTGHLIVAQIAYDNLTPKTKAWAEKLIGAMNRSAETDDNFVTSATWPDRIKKNGFHLYDEWHTVYLPYSIDNTPATQPEKQNAIWAIAETEKILRSSSEPDQKAMALKLFIHLVGDIHNPLHAVNYFSKQHPNGDHGGDYFFIKTTDGLAVNLHYYWDTGLGLFDNYQKIPGTERNNYIKNEAKKLEKLYPDPKMFIDSRSIDAAAKNWAEESYALATSFAYRTIENSTCQKKYVDEGKEIVQERLVQAGYRLANSLNMIAD